MIHADAYPGSFVKVAQAPAWLEPGGIPAAGLLLLPLIPFVTMSVGRASPATTKKSHLLPLSSASSSP
jgi:hypothetical protein